MDINKTVNLVSSHVTNCTQCQECEALFLVPCETHYKERQDMQTEITEDILNG